MAPKGVFIILASKGGNVFVFPIFKRPRLIITSCIFILASLILLNKSLIKQDTLIILKRFIENNFFKLFQKRDILSRTKQARDALRIDNQRLRQSCGLLGNEPLLRDFEERKDESDDLRERLDRLKMTHAELTLNCNQVRRKIEQARQNRG